MDNDIKLYSTHCPHCRTLEMLLKKKNIPFKEIEIDANNPESIQQMIDLGLKSAPGLVVDGRVMDFISATKWINEKK